MYTDSFILIYVDEACDVAVAAGNAGLALILSLSIYIYTKYVPISHYIYVTNICTHIIFYLCDK